MNSKLSYRSDIDGLRAVAVLGVVFYHAGMKLFSGGYVGVDVFFVISGFLITTIIVREIEAGEFSIIKFYERRIRRIYPALYTNLLFILIAAYFLYNPEVFAQACKSILATIGFVSNILFWTQSGYFAAPATLTPLLHTWSLAVEEQFYIFFPLLVLLIMRYARKWLKAILGMLALLSFFLSLYYINQDASASFYFPHLRAWELLIGGLLSINVIPAKINSTLRHVLSIIGLGMILISILSYSENTSFPAASALLPTLGSALIIYSGMGGESFVGKILSWSPFVFIGKISYSFYLWHWPVIIFGRYYLIQSPTGLQMFLLVAASFLFSAFSWLVVERPFRSRSFLPAPRIFVFAGSVMAVALLISGVFYLKQGLPDRFSKEELATFSDTTLAWGDQKKCVQADLKAFKDINRCMLGDGTSEPSFILWGDSHAQALAPAFDAVAKQYDVTGYLANHPACPPLLDVYRTGDATCLDFNNAILKDIEAHPEWKTVILSGRWALSANGQRYKTEEGDSAVLIDVESSVPAGSNPLIFENGMDRTIQKLLELNRKVIIISTVPEVGYDVPSAYFIALRTGRDINKIIAPTTNEYNERNAIVTDVFNKMESRYNIQVIDPTQILCDKNICNVVLDGQSLYRDSHHISRFGALDIANIFVPIFEQ